MVRVKMIASTSQPNNSLTSYERLKAIALAAKISPRTLEQLKSVFISEIASTRRLDCIRSVADFIDVLERRDELTEDNVKFFYKLAHHCQLQSLSEALSAYCSPKYIYPNSASQFENVYREHRRLNEAFQNSMRLSGNFTNSIATNGDVSSYGGGCGGTGTRVLSAVSFVGPLTNEKRKAIYKKLCKELGRDWRNFGRELNITEGEIDNIESQAQDLSTRISKLLKIFEEDECNDPREHCLLLCRALDECQRKDLRRHIEKIMSY